MHRTLLPTFLAMPFFTLIIKNDLPDPADVRKQIKSLEQQCERLTIQIAADSKKMRDMLGMTLISPNSQHKLMYEQYQNERDKHQRQHDDLIWKIASLRSLLPPEY